MKERFNNFTIRRIEFASFLIIALAILIIIEGIILAVYFSLWNGKEDFDSCNDFNPCSNNKILPDSSCINRILENGTSCSKETVCFNSSSSQSFCQAGECIGDRKFCRGFCNFDSDCPNLPFSPRLGTIIPNITCMNHSCIYTIVGGLTDDCLSWIDFTPSNPVVLQNCLIFRFTDIGFSFPPGICFIRYKCAPFDFETGILSIKSSSYDEYYKKSFKAISFFKNNNLLFDDLPNFGYNLVDLYHNFDKLINNSISLFELSLNINFKNRDHHKKKF